MNSYISYTPSGSIAKAMFNFDAFGISNSKFASGIITISVSDAFTYYQYLLAYPTLYSNVYTNLLSGSAGWNVSQLTNINAITSSFSAFANLKFSSVINYSGYTPGRVGSASDINISLISRPLLDSSGESSLNYDRFGYNYSRGDVVINVDQLGAYGIYNDYSFDSSSFSYHTLMHEIGHSLGLSHPHSSWNGSASSSALTSDFNALFTTTLGFEKLGFQIKRGADLNKEYFTIMSYDDQGAYSLTDSYAQTPMILDVIALQEAYGEGLGSSGLGNDIIKPGASNRVGAYRTYLDKGGVDTIDASNYSSGAYVHLGTTIVGAKHLVGVAMSINDGNSMVSGGSPQSLRWLYGEYENATGSASGDVIIGNSAANILNGGAGIDALIGGLGNDTYVVDNASDVTTETSAILSEIDTVQSSVTRSLGNYLENLTLTGGAVINGTGNALDNTITGNSAANILNGGAGIDALIGGLGVDTLIGGTGADTLVINAVVGSSSDSSRVIIAGNENDTGQDKINGFEIASDTLKIVATNVNRFEHGVDTALGNTATIGTNDGTQTSFTNMTGLIELNQVTNSNWKDLGDIALTFTGAIGALSEANFESRLQYNLTGTANGDTLTGGSLSDTLNGGIGNDILNGGIGNDTLIGGAGIDYFVFNTAYGSTNKDTITDFNVADDAIRLENSVFTKLVATGTLNATMFRKGAGITTAGDSNDHIIYNTTSGALYYDADANGGAAAVQIALIGTSTHAALTNADFVVI